MTFEEWLRIGFENSWCGPVVCSTHDGIPMTADEDGEFIGGFDPCVSVVRIYESPEQRAHVEDAHGPSVWRASNAGLV